MEDYPKSNPEAVGQPLASIQAAYNTSLLLNQFTKAITNIVITLIIFILSSFLLNHNFLFIYFLYYIVLFLNMLCNYK